MCFRLGSGPAAGTGRPGDSCRGALAALLRLAALPWARFPLTPTFAKARVVRGPPTAAAAHLHGKTQDQGLRRLELARPRPEGPARAQGHLCNRGAVCQARRARGDIGLTPPAHGAPHPFASQLGAAAGVARCA